MKITNKTIILITTLIGFLSLAFIAASLLIHLDTDENLPADETAESESTSLSIDIPDSVTSPPDTLSETLDDTTAEETQAITAGATAAPDTAQEETTSVEATIAETTVVETTAEETTVEETTYAETTEAETTAEITTPEVTTEETTAPVESTEEETSEEDTEPPAETTEHTHKYPSWAIKKIPTCEEEGLIYRSCSCGETEYLSLPASGHTETLLPAVEPTCTSEGKTQGSGCSECGRIFVEQTAIPKLECKYENFACIYCGRFKEDIFLSLTSPYAGLYKADTLECLYSISADVKVPQASLTKMITACVALEHMSPNEIITVGTELELVPKASSLCFIYKGNRIKLYDLLTGMMLRSGNDAAYVVAAAVGRHVSGNQNMSDRDAVDYFCSLMNDYAKKIGANNTNFTTPDGYDSENQYSTVSDLALITAHAMKNKIIAEIVATQYKRVVFASGQIANWENTNELMDPDSKYYTPCVNGFKTGTTEKAGTCLSATFEHNGETYIAIVLGCEDNDSRYENILKLIELITKS